MSADNGIYILETKEAFMHEGNGRFLNMFDNPVLTWRVAHIQGIDNLDYYEEKRPYMVGHCLMEMFGKSKEFYKIQDAYAEVSKLEEKYDYLEYGAGQIIKRHQYDLS